MIDFGNSATIHGDLEVQSFDMMNCAKGFHILISRIYTRKIEAVIREVMCNAYDSHIAAKCEHIPVKVTLPTLDDPHFRVQDFGVSLREDQMKMYITLFDSSKENSASETGYYGLGCKSPFAYTNAFNIEVVKDGKCRMYSAFMDGNSAPKLAKLFEMETTDPQGVTVIVPVKAEDFRRFEQTYEKVAQWFPTTPVCQDTQVNYALSRSIYAVSDATVLDNDNGRLWYKRNYSDQGPGDFKIVMGNVAYDANVDAIVHDMTSMNHQQRRLMSYFTGILKVPNGAIDIPPSRENVEYTPKTIAYLSGIFEEAYNTIVQTHRDEFDAMKNVDFFKSIRILDKASNVGLSLPKSDLDHFFEDVKDLIKDDDVVVRLANRMGDRVSRYSNNVKGKVESIVWNIHNAVTSAESTRENSTYYMNPKPPKEEYPVYFVIGDHGKTTGFFKDNNYEYGKKDFGCPVVLEIRRSNKIRRGKSIETQITELKTILAKFFSEYTVKLSSEMIAADNTEERELVRNRSEFLKIYAQDNDYWYTANRDSVSSSAWREYDPDKVKDKPVLAIARRNYDVYFPDGTQIDNLNHYIRNLRSLKLIPDDTVVVSCMFSAFDRIGKLLPGAKTLSDITFTLDDVKDHLQILFAEGVADALNLKNVFNCSIYSSASSIDVAKYKKDDHVLYKYLKDLGNSPDFEHSNRKYCTTDYILEAHGVMEEAKAYMVEEAKKRYAGIEKYEPVLRILARDSDAESFFDEYDAIINMIDKDNN